MRCAKMRLNRAASCAILRTMTYLQDMAAIEAAAGQRQMSVASFCKSAGVSVATWQRWKAGKTTPTFRTWQRVQDQAQALGFVGEGA